MGREGPVLYDVVNVLGMGQTSPVQGHQQIAGQDAGPLRGETVMVDPR